MPKHIDKSALNAAAEALRALEPNGKRLSARQAVAELEPDIRAAMAKGYTIGEIAERLHDQLKLSEGTLRGYLASRAVVNPPPGSARPRRKKSA